MTTSDNSVGVRIDKWLWAARFFKTRSLARQAIEAGHVRINEQRCKPAREPVPGDLISIVREKEHIDVVVRALSNVRGPAPQARTLYDETPMSIARRELEASERAASRTQTIQTGPRPTKRDRRKLQHWREDA
jgi:ribosome-associated heat shock protein Hsp15